MPQKLQAMVDVVQGTPFTSSKVYNKDGEASYVFTPVPIGAQTIPCAASFSGAIWYLYNFLLDAIISFVIYVPGTTYRRNAIVRYGLNDYIALQLTASVPGTAPYWALIRANIQGPAGEDGTDASAAGI